MKRSWEVKKLGEVCEIKTGKKDVNQGNPDGEFPFFTCAREHTYSDEFSFDTEALLIAGNGDVGTVSYYKGKFEAYQRTYVLFNFKNISPRFLFLILDGYFKKAVSKQKLGNTMPYIKMGMLADFEIPFPPFSEQQHIVSVLEEAFVALDKAKENAEKNLQSARELFESYLQSVFVNAGDGLEVKRLIEICEIRPPKNEARAKLKDTDTVSFVPMEDLRIKQKWFVPAKERRLKEVKGSYTYFANGDVLLAKITPCFENGKLGIASNLKNSVGFGSSEFIVFRTNKALSPEFLYYYLLREEFRQEGSKRMMGAVGHKRVSKEFVENSIIPVPSLLDQKRIVTKLDVLFVKTNKLETIYQQKLADLEELKKSILQKVLMVNL